MTEASCAVFLDQLQPQVMALLGSWSRGSLPRERDAAAVVEVVPGIDAQLLSDLAVKVAEVHLTGLIVERRFGYVVVSGQPAAIRSSFDAVNDAVTLAEGADVPQILSSEVVTASDLQHAFLNNRSRLGSLVHAGESMYFLEVSAAPYALYLANELEKRCRLKLVDLRFSGPSGRLVVAGSEGEMREIALQVEPVANSYGWR